MFKSSGLFQAPPEMVNQIFTWAREKICGKLLYEIDRYLDYKKKSKSLSAESENDDFITEQLLLRQKANQYAKEPLIDYHFTREFPINIKNWKYIPDTSREQIERLIQNRTFNYDDIFVHIFVDFINKKSSAQWEDNTKILTLFININKFGNVNAFMPSLMFVHSLIEHELQHFAQAFLSDILEDVKKISTYGYNIPGTPKETDVIQPKKRKHTKVERYYLTDTEFYPHLNDFINLLSFHLEKIPKQYRKEVLRAILNRKYVPKFAKGTDYYIKLVVKDLIHWGKNFEWLNTLRKFDPEQFRKAAIEIVKTLANKLEFSDNSSFERISYLQNWRFRKLAAEILYFPLQSQPMPLQSEKEQQFENLDIKPVPNFDTFTIYYIDAALANTIDDDYNVPLVENYDIADFDQASLYKMMNDCKKFQEENIALLDIYNKEYGIGKAGFNFWISRNNLGLGFEYDYDVNDTDDVGNKLAKAAKGYGEVFLYIGDDNKVYISR